MTDRYDVVLVRIDSKGHLWDTYGPFQDDWREAMAALQERSPYGMTIDATFLRPLSDAIDRQES